MDASRRKKWVGIADRYPKMKPAEQQRLQKRMKDWSALTPHQRKAARERYQRLRKLTPKQRKVISQQWREYKRSLAQPETPFDPAVSEPLAPDTPVDAPAAERQ